MKLILFIAVFCIAFGCSHDQLAPDELIYTSSKVTSYPSNSLNIYDDAGALHNEIVESFLQSGDTVSTTFGIITSAEAIANQNPDFTKIKPFDYATPLSSKIDSLLSDTTPLETVLDKLSLSFAAKTSLTIFVDSLINPISSNADYDLEIYPYIVDYESDIINSTVLTQDEKRVILTTTSILRYAYYFKKKVKRRPVDRDWYISIGNVAAGTQGSLESEAKAAMMATVTGLIINK